MQPLVLPSDLDGFPGAPFSHAVATAASEAVRRECGWHIAPQVTQTLTLDVSGGPVLILPTLRLVSVSEVRDMTGDNPRVLTGWRMSQAGMLSRRGGWPCGFGAVEVDVVHGYEQCPPELLPVIASSAHRRVRQESMGGRSVTFVDDDTIAGSSVLSRFRLGPRP